MYLFCNDTATTEIYTLTLHDALPIFDLQDRPPRRRRLLREVPHQRRDRGVAPARSDRAPGEDRKSTRLNSSHANISYAVFCLKKSEEDYHDSHPFQRLLGLLALHLRL